MENKKTIHCRVAACYEPSDDDNEWSYYLINDCEVSLDEAILYLIEYEWGGAANEEHPDVVIKDLRPGANALIWRDDGSGAELRMGLFLRVRVGDQQERCSFEFPKTLYRKRNMPLVDGLGKAGWVGTPQG